jgi:hypothetical protein
MNPSEEEFNNRIEIEHVQSERQIRDFRTAIQQVAPKNRSTRRSGKEVIQPQVPLRLPCYDFAPVTALALGGLVPCGFRHRLWALTASMA